MKKIEQSTLFLENHLSFFQCPVCQNEMVETKGMGMICIENHQFDLSKKGTIHLLQKGGQNEYDKEMLVSRKRLADTGFFYPILDEVYRQIPDHSSSLLDVGCGEGSHLHYLTEKGLKGTKIGFDISKAAIQLAAANFFDDAFWCVADLAQSPFAEGKYDVILNIFSPSHYEEFDRLLKVGGRVLKVVLEADYLVELREQLYQNDNKNRAYDNQAVLERFALAYPDFEKHEVTYQMELTKEMYNWLLEMTPLSWGASIEAIEKAKQHPLKSITIAVSVLIGSK